MAKKKKSLVIQKEESALDIQKKYQHRMTERAKEIEERIKGRQIILEEAEKKVIEDAKPKNKKKKKNV